jgi:hypothetical protein
MENFKDQIQSDTQELVEQWSNVYGSYEASLVVHRVGFACYGSPTEEKDGKCGYPEEQQKHIQRVTDIILDGRKTGSILLVEVIVYYLATDKSLRSMFVFLYQDATGKRLYTDFSERTYASWQDWLDWNTLPASELRFPQRGCYPVKGTKVVIDSGHSPAACIGHKTVAVADTTALVVGVGLAAVAIGSFFFPPAAAAIPFIVGGEITVAGYSVVRSTSGLIDRAQHGQSCSLYNSEARGLWLGIGLSLVAGGAGIAAKSTKKLVDAGKAVSATRAAITNTLNVSKLSLSAVQIIDRSVHLISNPDKVTPLGVFQVAVAVFFFTRSVQEFQIIAATSTSTPATPAATATTPVSNKATEQAPSPARAEAQAKYDARAAAARQAKSDMAQGLPQRDIPKATTGTAGTTTSPAEEVYLAARLASHEERWSDPGLQHQIGIITRKYKFEEGRQEELNKKLASSDNPGENKKIRQQKIDSAKEEKRLREKAAPLFAPDHSEQASHRQRITQLDAEIARHERAIAQEDHSTFAAVRNLMK